MLLLFLFLFAPGGVLLRRSFGSTSLAHVTRKLTQATDDVKRVKLASRGNEFPLWLAVPIAIIL